MFKNSSPQTKSFIILLAVAVIGAYFCLWLAGNYLSSNRADKPEYSFITYNQKQKESSIVNQAAVAEPEPVVDTSNWKRYANETFGFSFKYDPAWQIKQFTKQGDFQVLEIDPGKKYYNMKIFVSQKGFFAMDGLPAQETEISGLKALSVANLLYGIQKGLYYYTFDNGQSVSLKPQFNALVSSLEF